jgi:hypothetical protein
VVGFALILTALVVIQNNNAISAKQLAAIYTHTRHNRQLQKS